MKLQPVFSPLAPKPIGPYSQAIQIGEMIYLSGQIPLDPATGKLVEGDFKTQTRRIFENIRQVLAAAGSDLKQVVKSTVFMMDLKEFQYVNEVFSEYFSEPYPARSTVQVAGLPAGARVEIEVMACLK